MIRNPIDIASRVSPELSGFIQSVVDQLDTDEPITLSAIRSFITHELPSEIDESEHMHHFDVEESLVDELDALIEQFGESAAAVDFVYAFASEALSRAIEAMMNEENSDESPPTLAVVREEMQAGLAGRLVGEGVLEDDETEALLTELDALIDRYGEESPAENFLRYE